MDEQKKNYKNFNNLKELRKNLVKINKDNGTFLGLKGLLTKLYPDKAHFIYELLQNAEDQRASEVIFTLFKDRLVFTHNGENDFTLENIDSITKIGDSTKADDPTTIGKFGIGFKAVYAYTNTPEIHSGKFDFKIEEMFIPEDVGVEKRAKEGTTEFIFPFDNPNKAPDVAVKEIEDALKALDETAILFLRRIKLIRFTLPNQYEKEISVHSNTTSVNFIEEIDIKSNRDSNVKKTFWAKFESRVSIDIEGDKKQYPVSLAYKLKPNDETETYVVDSQLMGKVCIYFPTDINSILHFHINAPFASTVARDNIRYCEENEQLFNHLSDLFISSIYDLKKYKMLDYSAYEALPTKQESESYMQGRFKIFYTKMFNEFEKSALFIDENGDYKTKEEIFIATNDVKKALPLKYVDKYYGKTWIPTIKPATRIESFFNQFSIKNYTMKRFLEELKKNPNFFDELFSDNANIDYMKHLYSELSKLDDFYYSDISERVSKKDVLQNVKFILCQDMQLHSISERLYFKTNYEPKLIQNPLYVDLGKDSKEIEPLKGFFTSLGVKEMTMELDTMSEIEGDVNPDNVVLKLLEIIELYNETHEIDKFKEISFILARSVDNKQLERVKAKDCCWDETVHFFYAEQIKYVVAKDCYQSLNEDEWKTFKEIFAKLGGKVAPIIYECEISRNHPEYEKLNTYRARYNSVESTDFTITGLDRLENISKEKRYDEAFLLWRTIVDDSNSRHLYAKYRPNKSASWQTIGSSLAYRLKNIEWIPNRNGEFKRPCDITEEELRDEYEHPSHSSVLLDGIGFGKKSLSIINIVEKAGIEVSDTIIKFLKSSSKNQEAAMMFIEQCMKEEKESENKMSLKEALASENKDQAPFEEEDDYGRDIGIKNPQRRYEKLEDEFEEGIEQKPTKKSTVRYVTSNGTKEEKQFVREQYNGRCQICGRQPIKTYNGDIYFEAINILPTNHLDSKLLNDIDKGWNTLCLCPNCAAEYKYCQKDLNGFEKIDTIEAQPGQNEYISIDIILQNKPTQIKFTPKHFIALKTAFNVYKKHDKND